MRRASVALALLIVPSLLHAQTRSPRSRDEIVGWVVDAAGKPMGDAEVLIAGTTFTTRSDARGFWRIADPPTGPHVVLARQIGYVPYQREVVVGRAANDTLSLLLRRYPRTLSTVEVTARSNSATASAVAQGQRLIQMRVGAGRLYTRDYILETRPYSIAELVQGVPGMTIQRLRGNGTDGEVVATISRNRGGASGNQGVGNDGLSNACPMQFFLDTSPIEGDQVGRLDPSMFRSVEVYPMNVVIPGLPQRGDRCGAIVINSFRR
ncbi:carboxypeptidase regulatory-like domain-containing protein [Gemmatimonas sp.]|uniref:carboxypeptidase regulatory-like domain-containing protein n=1 Tax=Gemmatimonas sp. TaxID=1962908 RepID=UPI00356699D8